MSLAIASDPGNLDPQASPSNVNLQLARFAYDSLVAETPSGKIVSELATDWKPVHNGYQFTMRKDVTCSDGSLLKPSTVAANFQYIQDPKSRSPLYGGVVPAGLMAKGDDAAGTVTLSSQEPVPFILQSASALPIVCAKGMADRSMLQSETDGTGPYVLSDLSAGSAYNYVRRPNYKWGPNGVATSVDGQPEKLAVKVVPDETTEANLLLGGQVNVATVSGPDRTRLESANLFSATGIAPLGEMFFNQGSGHPAEAEAVRQALAAGADLGEVGKVLSGGFGQNPTSLVSIVPKPCEENSVEGNVPSFDLAAAEAKLDEAGWVADAGGMRSKDGKELTISLLYDPSLTSNASSAAELLAEQWKALGVGVQLNAQPVSKIEALTISGGFDAVWLPININYPTMIMPFLTGPTPPQGLNFSHIENAAYDSATKAAMSKSGTEGCADWNRAEAAVFRAADIVPFVDSSVPTWGKDASFDLVGGLIVPTSLRLSGS